MWTARRSCGCWAAGYNELVKSRQLRVTRLLRLTGLGAHGGPRVGIPASIGATDGLGLRDLFRRPYVRLRHSNILFGAGYLALVPLCESLIHTPLPPPLVHRTCHHFGLFVQLGGFDNIVALHPAGRAESINSHEPR